MFMFRNGCCCCFSTGAGDVFLEDRACAMESIDARGLLLHGGGTGVLIEVGVEMAVRGGVCGVGMDTVVDGESGLEDPSLYLKDG